MHDNAGKLYIANGIIEDSGKAQEIDAKANRIVYEVIRIIDGVPLFYEDHYSRLTNSLKTLGSHLETGEKLLKEQVTRLAAANGETNCNVKITIYDEAGMQKYRLYISKSYYPSKEEVEQGVKTGLFHWERKNPNVKVIDQTYKEEAARLISENGLFEVLLVDKYGKLTEGSKSNVFFVKGDKIFTAPSESELIITPVAVTS
jgi:branched-chain amino acid aminotransferase